MATILPISDSDWLKGQEHFVRALLFKLTNFHWHSKQLLQLVLVKGFSELGSKRQLVLIFGSSHDLQASVGGLLMHSIPTFRFGFRQRPKPKNTNPYDLISTRFLLSEMSMFESSGRTPTHTDKPTQLATHRKWDKVCASAEIKQNLPVWHLPRGFCVSSWMWHQTWNSQKIKLNLSDSRHN